MPKLWRLLIGCGLTLGATWWWNAELSSRLGREIAREATTECLLNFGTGNCGNLWFVGLHQTNQIASLIFYGGIVTVLSCLFSRKPTSGDQQNQQTPP